MDSVLLIIFILIIITFFFTLFIKLSGKNETVKLDSIVIANKQLSEKGFVSSKIERTNSENYYVIALDETNRQIAFLSRKSIHDDFSSKIIKFDDIIEAKIITDNSSVVKTSKGNMVAGAIIGGGIGALVAGVASDKTSYDVMKSAYLEIVTNDISNPSIKIPFVTEWEAMAYKNSNKLKDAKEKLDYWFRVMTVVDYRNKNTV